MKYWDLGGIEIITHTAYLLQTHKRCSTRLKLCLTIVDIPSLLLLFQLDHLPQRCDNAAAGGALEQAAPVEGAVGEGADNSKGFILTVEEKKVMEFRIRHVTPTALRRLSHFAFGSCINLPLEIAQTEM